jgi:hypothetical protein
MANPNAQMVTEGMNEFFIGHTCQNRQQDAGKKHIPDIKKKIEETKEK